MTAIEKPMLYCAPMVLALLDGRKKNTRRLVKPQPHPVDKHLELHRDGTLEVGISVDSPNHYQLQCPHPIGSKIWVRETWQYADWTENGQPWIKYKADGKTILYTPDCELTVIWANLSDPDNFKIDGKAADRKWRSPIFMPRWASRITLEVTGVRVEIAGEISEADARAEGFASREEFFQLFEKLNGNGSLEKWVWVYTFKRIK